MRSRRYSSAMGHPSENLRREVTRFDDYTLEVIGLSRAGMDDLVHVALAARWLPFLASLCGAYLALNAVFAVVYRIVGGIAGVTCFLDAFYFSVQTLGTIGYGSMSPATHAANGVVVVESMTGLVFTALATGLVFMRFSRARTKIRFATRVVVTPIDGVPTLVLRVGNERRGNLVDASARLTITRSRKTKEGTTIYFAEHLPLVHERAPVLTRALTLRHTIDEKSPLAKDTPASFVEGEIELSLAMGATDETTLQPVHARKTWSAKRVVWGARLADLMSEPTPDRIVLDLRRFDDLVPSERTEGFPYSAREDELA